MSDQKDLDPIEMLRAINPVDQRDVPSASFARVSAKVQETIMSDIGNETIQRPRIRFGVLGLAAGVVAVLALAVTVGLPGGLGSPSGVAVVPTSTPGEPTAQPTDGGGSIAGGGGMASCLAYDPAIVPTFDLAFDGTVTAVNGDQVTFVVNTDFKGGAGDTITLTSAQGDNALVGPGIDFGVGGRYLVSGAGSDVNQCGFTLPHSDNDAAAWAAAFEG